MSTANDRDRPTQPPAPRALPPDHAGRMHRALRSLDGLSVGDALGEQFFGRDELVVPRIERREVPPGPWTYTDDTEMGLAVVEVLAAHGHIDQDALADRFARRYQANRRRGYGGGARELLEAVNLGLPWRETAAAMFEGQGSYGNGAAMRVAPLGAYFAGDTDAVITQARLSAQVTHTHPDAQAGAIAVALAASFTHVHRDEPFVELGEAFFAHVLAHTPPSATRDGIEHAARLFAQGASLPLAARALGTGYRVSSQDTVPFCLFCLAHHLDDFENAFWTTVSGLGDRDTTCAIVGGVVALRSPPPEAWKNARETPSLSKSSA